MTIHKSFIPGLLAWLVCSHVAEAQWCPPPARFVSGGGGLMCVCPDGSGYNLGQACRSYQPQASESEFSQEQHDAEEAEAIEADEREEQVRQRAQAYQDELRRRAEQRRKFEAQRAEEARRIEQAQRENAAREKAAARAAAEERKAVIRRQEEEKRNAAKRKEQERLAEIARKKQEAVERQERLKRSREFAAEVEAKRNAEDAKEKQRKADEAAQKARTKAEAEKAAQTENLKAQMESLKRNAVQLQPPPPADQPKSIQSPPSPPAVCSTFNDPTAGKGGCPNPGTIVGRTTRAAPTEPASKKPNQKDDNPFTRQPTSDEIAKSEADQKKREAEERKQAARVYIKEESNDNCGTKLTEGVRRTQCAYFGGGKRCIRTITIKRCESRPLRDNCETISERKEEVCLQD